MNPEEAKLIIERLIEEHGPDCGETGHFLGLRNGKPVFTHTDTGADIFICKVDKSGMKRGFVKRSWDFMAYLLSKAVNEAGKG